MGRARTVGLLVLSAALSLPGVRGLLAAAERPNIVIILADDLGYGDPRCYNADSKIPTPNIDRLAQQGMRFTDAHTPSSVCTPTRYGLLTGRYCWRTRLKSGVLKGYSRALIEPDRPTIGTLAKKYGYRTAAIGKWHLGFQTPAKGAGRVDYDLPLRPGPITQGFDYFFGIPASLDFPPYVFVRNDRPIEPLFYTIGASQHRRRGGGGFWRAGRIGGTFRHIDCLPRLTREALWFIQDHVAHHADQPFLLYFALTAPHTPWLPTAEFRGKSGAGYYGDFVVQVDWVVGQILAELDRHDLTENTLVLFTSDNGAHWLPRDIQQFGHRANGPWRGQKADIHEGGHRVPFIVRWPGRVPPGSISDQLVCLTDVYATLAEILGHPLSDSEAEDSYSFLPSLTGKPASGPVRHALVSHSGWGMFAIRDGHWKLILGLGSGGFTPPTFRKPGPGEPPGQLYNLADDPAETRNVYADYPEIVDRLQRLLETYKQSGRSRP